MTMSADIVAYIASLDTLAQRVGEHKWALPTGHTLAVETLNGHWWVALWDDDILLSRRPLIQGGLDAVFHHSGPIGPRQIFLANGALMVLTIEPPTWEGLLEPRWRTCVSLFRPGGEGHIYHEDYTLEAAHWAASVIQDGEPGEPLADFVLEATGNA